MIGASICSTAKGQRDESAEKDFIEYYRNLDKNRTSRMNQSVVKDERLESRKDAHSPLTEQLPPENKANKAKGQRDESAEKDFIEYYRNLDKKRTSRMNQNVVKDERLESRKDAHSPLKEQLPP